MKYCGIGAAKKCSEIWRKENKRTTSKPAIMMCAIADLNGDNVIDIFDAVARAIDR